MPDNITEVVKALAEPARLAIEKLSGGIGRLYEPAHIRRVGRAIADKHFIEAIAEQDIALLLEASENRATYRKVRQELNLNLIADRAAHLLEDGDTASASAPADEWVDEFTDQSKDASSNELRELWARLYVAETKESGTVPRRVLRLVKDLDASLARSFTQFLSCSVTADDGRIVVFTFKEWMMGLDLTARSFNELNDIGLVDGSAVWNSKIGTGYYRLNHGKLIRLTFEGDKAWNVRVARLTSAGVAIAAVVERSVNEQYVRNFCTAAEAAGAKVERIGWL